MAKLNDSYTKAWNKFTEIHGSGWMKHIHPHDRDEICGYLIRMVGDQPARFNVWNAAVNRPNGVDKIEGTVKTQVTCTPSKRTYYIECAPRG